MRPILFFCLFSCFSAVANVGFSGPTPPAYYLLQGTIGKSAVVMQITTHGTTVEGSYFYRKTGKDISFSGTKDNLSFTFKTLAEDADDADREQFQLTKSGDQFTGTWSKGSKKLKVVLSSLPKAAIINPYKENRQLDHYEEYPFQEMRISLVAFERLDSITIVNGVTFQWFKEVHWNSVMPRVVKGLPMKKIAYINDVLEAMQIDAFEGHANCDFEAGYQHGVVQMYVDTSFFSIQTWEYYACDHARPDDIVSNFNYDIRGERQLLAEDLWQFPGFVSQKDVEFDVYSGYQHSISERIHNYFKAAYSEYYPPEGQSAYEDGSADCNFDDPDIWTFSDILITSKGLLVEPYFPTMYKYCNNPEWSVIPFGTFKEYLNPDYRKALLKIRQE